MADFAEIKRHIDNAEHWGKRDEVVKLLDQHRAALDASDKGKELIVKTEAWIKQFDRAAISRAIAGAKVSPKPLEQVAALLAQHTDYLRTSMEGQQILGETQVWYDKKMAEEKKKAEAAAVAEAVRLLAHAKYAPNPVAEIDKLLAAHGTILDSTPEGKAAAASAKTFADSKRPKTVSGPPKCAKAHPCVFGENGFRCDNSGCGNSGSGKHFRCNPCNYDFCLTCAPLDLPIAAPAAAAAPTMASAPLPYKCPKNHLAVLGSNGFTCDRCKKSSNTGQHFRCNPCNYDFCVACAPVTPEAIAAASPTPAPVAPPVVSAQPVVAKAAVEAPSKPAILLPYKCAKEHTMTVCTNGFGCDRTGCGGRGSGDHFGCRTCNYDYCNACAPVTPEAITAATPKPAVAPAAPIPPPAPAATLAPTDPVTTTPDTPSLPTMPLPYKCAKQHTMTVSGNGFSCDRSGCSKKGSGDHFSCRACNYDCCQSCAPMTPEAISAAIPPMPKPAAPSAPPALSSSALGNAIAAKAKKWATVEVDADPTPRCSLGHVTTMMHRDYTCDKCGKGPFANTHYMCKPCNYDLCAQCAPEIATKPTVLDPASIPKCKNSHTCSVVSNEQGYCSSDCPNSWRGAHWACQACGFHWCLSCHPVPREAAAAAGLLLQVAAEVFVHGGANANWEHQKNLIVFYKNVVTAVKAAPAGSIAQETIDKTLADNEAVLKRFQETCLKDVKDRFERMSEKDKHSVNVVTGAGADVERALTQLCPKAPATVELAALRKAMLEAAKKWESEADLRREQEKAKMQLDWVDSHAPGGTVTVGSDSWVFTVEKPYATFKHTTRPELSFLWLVYRLPYGNFTMQCATKGDSDAFGLMRFTYWDGEWTLRYTVQATRINIQSEWLTLKWKEGEDALVSQSPENPSWRIKPDGVEACSQSANVPNGRATIVSGKVPFPLCIFAAACFPMMRKISAWEDEAYKFYEKQQEKERRKRGW